MYAKISTLSLRKLKYSLDCPFLLSKINLLYEFLFLFHTDKNKLLNPPQTLNLSSMYIVSLPTSMTPQNGMNLTSISVASDILYWSIITLSFGHSVWNLNEEFKSNPISYGCTRTPIPSPGHQRPAPRPKPSPLICSDREIFFVFRRIAAPQKTARQIFVPPRLVIGCQKTNLFFVVFTCDVW